ncbi:hypothetical protein M8818_002676 [Zalaria obscura]|uniref:Uncharacterized protein n=1 Tax=Zalaria obscura TaxID=2024903 RepID=A0ACC3SGK5_9PEZI
MDHSSWSSSNTTIPAGIRHCLHEVQCSTTSALFTRPIKVQCLGQWLLVLSLAIVLYREVDDIRPNYMATISNSSLDL